MRSIVALDAAELSRMRCPYCGRSADPGAAGFRAVKDGRTLGVLTFAQADRDLGPAGSFVVDQLWVAEGETGERVATHLLQKVCARLTGERARFLIAFGTSARSDCHRLPAGWLQAVGFRDHVAGAQWRLELRQTLPLASALRGVAGAALRVVRPGPGTPQPAGRVACRGVPR